MFFKKSYKLGQEWLWNQKFNAYYIGFWVFIIFHEGMHRWGKHNPPSLIK
jgi:hypothetical protein